MSSFPVLVRTPSPAGEIHFRLGDPLVDSYLEFVAGRARPNTLRAVAFDLKKFFSVIGKDPVDVVPVDVFEFLADQRGDRTVVRLSDGESGLSARTIARRLSSVSGFYAFLLARGEASVETNPVPRGLSTRRRDGRVRTVPLVRVPRTLPKILSPGDVDALGYRVSVRNASETIGVTRSDRGLEGGAVRCIGRIVGRDISGLRDDWHGTSPPLCWWLVEPSRAELGASR